MASDLSPGKHLVILHGAKYLPTYVLMYKVFGFAFFYKSLFWKKEMRSLVIRFEVNTKLGKASCYET